MRPNDRQQSYRLSLELESEEIRTHLKMGQPVTHKHMGVWLI